MRCSVLPASFARSSRHGKRDLPWSRLEVTPVHRRLLAQRSHGKRTGAGAYSVTAEPLPAPGDPRGSPRGLDCRVLRASRPGGCLSAPAFGVFQAARTHRLDARAHRGSAYRRAAPGSATAWVRREDRTGRAALVRTSLPHRRPPTSGLRSGRRPPSRQVLDPNVPSGQRRAIIGTRPRCGDSRARGYRRPPPHQRCRLGQASATTQHKSRFRTGVGLPFA